MALTADEQALFNHARKALPHWFRADQRANEELGEAAKIMGSALAQVQHLLGTEAFILTATGATTTEPDWLNEHARDRGTRRQAGESDAALADRIRKAPVSITRYNLLKATQDLLATYGITDDVFMVELPRDSAYVGKVTMNTNPGGGTFTGPDGSGLMTFSPQTNFRYAPFKHAAVNDPFTAISGRDRTIKLHLSLSAHPANNGTFTIVALDGSKAVYANGSGVAEVDLGCTWRLERYDMNGILRDDVGHSFLSRGERMGRGHGWMIVVILPYGTTAEATAAVTELLRQRKGAGVILKVETRTSPP